MLKKIATTLIAASGILCAVGTANAQYVGPSQATSYRNVAEILKNPVDDVRVTLESRIHCPNHIVHIKAVHIFIYKKHMLQLTKCRKCQQGSLPLPSLITCRQLFELEHSHIFSTTS